MLILLTEWKWKLEPIKEDGSLVLDVVPTVGGQIPIRLSIDDETRRKLGAQLLAADDAPVVVRNPENSGGRIGPVLKDPENKSGGRGF